MRIRYGYELELECVAPTPCIFMLDIRPEERDHVLVPDRMEARSLIDGSVIDASEVYNDQFGNVCRRLMAPTGSFVVSAAGVLSSSGAVDPQGWGAELHSPGDLHTDVIGFLVGSRYCETDKLSNFAWSRFSRQRDGYATVSSICQYVHDNIRFDYKLARSTRTAAESLDEKVGVCRDFTHAAITLCRCLNIPARYCTGYLGDIGVPRDPAAMDFSAWFEAYIGGSWWTFDPRHNQPRIGRIVIARGRDAADVPIVMSFGQHSLRRFEVTTEESLEGVVSQGDKLSSLNARHVA
jgi:transglutaminase-like putative cysteine protease